MERWGLSWVLASFSYFSLLSPAASYFLLQVNLVLPAKLLCGGLAGALSQVKGSVAKSPVLKRASPFKRVFGGNRPFFCDFARFLWIFEH